MIEENKKPKARIIGADSNVFNLIGICQRELKRNGYREKAQELIERVTSSKSFDEALQIMTEYVNPVSEFGMDEDEFDIDI